MAVDNIRACRVSVSDVGKLAHELTQIVVDTSWMAHLDKGARRAYEKTVAETAALLIDIFKAASLIPPSDIQEEFGELMVSMGAARALNQVFSHYEVPLAELWKPQAKQNEGFDFHTVCPAERVHFGEAKYSSQKSPHGAAISQISSFLEAEKHFRDRTHLEKLVPLKAIQNLDNEDFGVVAAFSINAANPDIVIKNAITKAKALAGTHKISQIYLVGVVYDA
ncbi:hypothetical protein [Luteimonas gilva]|uniref:hypothetical protein n=1 Tax=Luteimonas gilva TaxID=2572684 RepID=UPI001CB8A08F|nr:hypothetical protein [Luteimonas gilva]